MFKYNPEEFINKVAKLINEQKAALIVEHVTYNQIEGEYEASIFVDSYDSLYNLVAGLSEPVKTKVISYDDMKLPEIKMVAEEREE